MCFQTKPFYCYTRKHTWYRLKLLCFTIHVLSLFRTWFAVVFLSDLKMKISTLLNKWVISSSKSLSSSNKIVILLHSSKDENEASSCVQSEAIFTVYMQLNLWRNWLYSKHSTTVNKTICRMHPTNSWLIVCILLEDVSNCYNNFCRFLKISWFIWQRFSENFESSLIHLSTFSRKHRLVTLR